MDYRGEAHGGGVGTHAVVGNLLKPEPVVVLLGRVAFLEPETLLELLAPR